MADSKRIVVAGATGFIGKRIIRTLGSRGDHVIALVRDVERGRRIAPGASDYFQWESSSAIETALQAIDGADAVINLAGAPIAERWSEEQKKRAYDSRIKGTRTIVEAIARAEKKPSTLINASAVGYYGTSPDAIFTEASSSGTDFLGTTCADWEREALQAKDDGVRVVLVRTGIVLDPKEGALAKMLPAFKLFAGGPLGSGRQWFPWIHIDDEIAMIVWALDNSDIEGPINAVAPGIVSNGTFSKVLGKVLGRPSFLPVPEFALKLLFGEGAMILTEGQHVVPERTEKLGYRFQFTDAEAALNELLGD